MLDVSDFTHEVWLFQRLYEVWTNGGTTNPAPFGSVFIINSPNPTPRFDFMHCLVTGTVAINIGDKFIFVALWDQGDGMHADIIEQWQTWHAPRLQSLRGSDEFDANCYLAPHVWACESAYWLYRHRRAFSILKTRQQIILVPPFARPEGASHKEAEYRQVCKNFGLDLVHYNGETSNIYRPIQFPS